MVSVTVNTLSLVARDRGGQFRADEARYASLLERCIPGKPLVESGMVRDEALICARDRVAELWISAHGDPRFEMVADVSAE
jgi:hypothetical protein